MGLVHRKGFALLFWLVAFLAGVAGLIYGGKAGYAAAPGFSDGSGANAGSQILLTILGAILGAAAVWAIFAAAWMGLWAASRRSNPYVDEEEYDDFDSLAADYDESEGDLDGDYDEEILDDESARHFDERDARHR